MQRRVIWTNFVLVSEDANDAKCCDARTIILKIFCCTVRSTDAAVVVLAVRVDFSRRRISKELKL
eukprot:SAG31_NODE_761_length_12276_cov_4.530673_16_plen_65_part_00